jgi:hypothetical protein
MSSEKFLISFLDGDRRCAFCNAYRFHFAGRTLCVLPIASVQRFANSLPGNPPINPDRASTLQVITTFIYMRAVFGMSSPQDKH